MKEIFNNLTDWLWPFLGNLFTTIFDFFGGVLHSFFENQNSIMSIVGFVFLALLGLFLLDKFVRFIVNYFNRYTKSDFIGMAIKAFIFIFVLLLLASFISYQTRTCS